MHGGSTPTKDENPDVGAPEGNQNHIDTGLGSDPANLFEWLKEKEPDAAAWVVAKLMSYAEQVNFEVFEIDVRDTDPHDFDEIEAGLTAKGDDLLYTTVKDYAKWQGTKRQLEEGFTRMREQETEFGIIEVEDANPVNLELDRVDRTTLKQRKTLDVYDGPESRKADALEGGLELTLTSDDKDTLEDAFDTNS